MASHDERAELIHLAQAFEGLVGALHEGHHVPRGDLEQAASAAKRLLEAVGHDPASDFPTHRRVLMEHAAGASRGDPREMSMAERVAHRIAKELRLRARSLDERRPTVAADLEDAVHRLDTRYARYAVHATAA